MKQSIFFLAMLLLISQFSCQSAYNVRADMFPKKLQSAISLKAHDNTVYDLADIYREHVGTVIIFWQSKCPCVKRYQERINNLYEHFSKEGVAFLHVSSNTNESFDEVNIEYKKRLIPLALLRDEEGKLAKALGAKGTPTAALFNQQGELIFLGWIDNERDVNETGRKAFLKNAIADLLANRPVHTPTSPMFGCTIR